MCVCHLQGPRWLHYVTEQCLRINERTAGRQVRQLDTNKAYVLVDGIVVS